MHFIRIWLCVLYVCCLSITHDADLYPIIRPEPVRKSTSSPENYISRLVPVRNNSPDLEMRMYFVRIHSWIGLTIKIVRNQSGTSPERSNQPRTSTEPVYFDFFRRVISVCGVSPSGESIFRILTFLRSYFCLRGLPFGGIHFQDSDFFDELFLSVGSPLRGNPFPGF